MRESPTVFFSYSSKTDSKVISQLTEALKKSGLNLNSFEDTPATEPANVAIRKMIERSDLVLVDLTGNNPNVMFELGLARGLGKQILPIIEFSEQKVPNYLNGILYIPYEPQEAKVMINYVISWIQRRYSESFGPVAESIDITQEIKPLTAISKSSDVSSDTLTLLFGDIHFLIKLRTDERSIIGRQSPYLTDRPDVDLSKLSTSEHGVSRIHATLERTDQGVYLMDLGSRNGTYVNGIALQPFSPHFLRSGDIVRFGALVCTVEMKITETNVKNVRTPSINTR